MDKNILVVARWPLGGIRTYMRYMFSHFPGGFKITLLAASTQENTALQQDVEKYGALLKLVHVKGTRDFASTVFRELCRNRYNLIISQGFVSAVSVYFANLLFRLPHMVTIHGIVEPQYLEGRFEGLKRWMLGRVLSAITVLYGVSHGILEHLYSEFPSLKNKGPQPLVILNGIEPADFDLLPADPIKLRETLKIKEEIFLFGFFGRFMPQKGFDLVIEAVDLLQKRHSLLKFAVVAVGSGDYIREYQITIRKKQLESFFYFFPFQPLVHHLYPQVDVVVMPSRWEACPLLPMEVLSMGVPLIASNCIGTREVIADTPVHVIEPDNIEQLVQAMQNSLIENDILSFKKFSTTARRRYDVQYSANQMVDFINNQLVLR